VQAGFACPGLASALAFHCFSLGVATAVALCLLSLLPAEPKDPKAGRIHAEPSASGDVAPLAPVNAHAKLVLPRSWCSCAIT